MATTEMVELFNVLTRRARRVGVRAYRTPKSKQVFTQYELLGVLVLKTVTRASYRTLSWFVPCVLGRRMHFTTPHKATQRFGPRLLARVMVACLPAVRGRVVAMDATGFSTHTRSEYYRWRIDDKRLRSFVKVTLLIDTRTQAILAARIHIMPRHDVRDAYQLAPHITAKHVLADKGYDSEQLHELLADKHVHIPIKAKTRKGFWRKKHAKTFQPHQYRKRALVETVNSVVKRRFGSHLAAKNIRMRRSEILLKLITHNLLTTIKTLYSWMISTQPARRAQPLNTWKKFALHYGY